MTSNFPTGMLIPQEIRLFSCFSIFQNRPNSALEEVTVFIAGEFRFMGGQCFFPGQPYVIVVVVVVVIVVIIILYGSPTMLCNIRAPKKKYPLPQRR